MAVPAPADPTTAVAAKKVIVAVFGAPWCHYCHENLPKVQRELDKLRRDFRDAIDFRLYVISGGNASTVANDTETLAYQRSIGLSQAVAYSDARGKIFKYYVGGGSIPAAAVVSADGKTVIKKYPGGSLDPYDIASTAAKEAAK